MADGWDPGTYERFREERRQPFRDLVGLVVPVPGGRVVDLGCGTGELTADLHRQLGAAETLGVDRSPSMLKDSVAYAGNGVRFERGDIAAFAGRDYDVVFANASLHWVEGQEALLARLAGALGPGGQLAFQVPANHDHPSHTVAAEVALDGSSDRKAPNAANAQNRQKPNAHFITNLLEQVKNHMPYFICHISYGIWKEIIPRNIRIYA